MKFKLLSPALALVVSLAAFSSAFAAGNDNHPLVLHLTGAAPTLAFGAPAVAGDLASYDYTNQGTGTATSVPPLTWQYDEKGEVIPPLGSSVITSATYEIEPAARPSIKLVLHVIPSTYLIHYDNPATAPCSTGGFTYSFAEGASAQGTFTFAPQPIAGLPCTPTASLDVTINANSQAAMMLRRGF